MNNVRVVGGVKMMSGLGFLCVVRCLVCCRVFLGGGRKCKKRSI